MPSVSSRLAILRIGHLPGQATPTITNRPARRSADVRADCRRLLEAAFERGFRVGVTDLRSAVSALPPLVRCAVRVHDRREARGALVLGVDVVGAAGRVERWPAVVARTQRLMLLFGPRGALEDAGSLKPHPSAPILPGARWTHIDWAPRLDERDWY